MHRASPLLRALNRWRSGSVRTAELPTADELYNAKLFAVEAPFIALPSAVGSFFALYAIRMGASNTAVGWLASGPALLNLFWLIPCGRVFQRAGSYIGLLNASVVLIGPWCSAYWLYRGSPKACVCPH
jgi:hypothetical protein